MEALQRYIPHLLLQPTLISDSSKHRPILFGEAGLEIGHVTNAPHIKHAKHSMGIAGAWNM